MKKYMLKVNAADCIGCFSCAVACKLEHDFPAGPRPFKVIQAGPLAGEGEAGDDRMHFLPVTCYHCDRPACVAACPTGAMQKRHDGIVFSDIDLCIGCQTCAAACPFGVPELNPANGKIAKCDGCRDRVDVGLWPACAMACPTDALLFGPPHRVIQDHRCREALKTARTFSPPSG